MDEKSLLYSEDKEALIQRINYLENEIKEIKKCVNPSEQTMDETKGISTEECCKDCSQICMLCALCELLNRR
jgi:hypothetical protein